MRSTRAPAAPTPQIVQQTVVVPVQQTVEVPVQQTVEVPVQQTVVVTQTVPPTQKTVVTIAYNGYFNQTFGPAPTPLQAIRDAVAKQYPDIEVNLNVMPYEAGAWHDLYVTWFQANDPTVDLIGVGGYWLAEFGQQGWLLPLDGKVPQDLLNQIDPAYVQAFTYNKQLLALGPWWGGVGGLYYRTDLLKKYNLQPPTTYDQLLSDAKTIMADNPNLSGWTWPALKDQVLVNRWVEYLSGFGGSNFDASGKCAMNSTQGVAALTFMKSLFDTGITPKEALTWKEEDSVTRFASGQAIFHTGRQDLTTWLDDPTKSKIPHEWAFIPNLATPPGKPAGYFEGWGFGINKNSKNPDAALKVLEVMYSLPVQVAFNLSQGPLQANTGVNTDPTVIKNSPYQAQIAAVAKTAMGPIPSPKYNDISLILQDDLSSALTGSMTPTDALNDVSAKIDALGK